MGQQRMLKKNNKKIKSVFISEKNHSHQTGEGNKFEQEIMWDNWSLPQGPPCWVLLKGSPQFLGQEKVERGPSLIADPPLSLSRWSAKPQWVPSPASSWMCHLAFPFFLGGDTTSAYSTRFESIKKRTARSNSCDCSDPGRTRTPHLPQAGVFQAPNLSLAYVNCGIIQYSCCSPSWCLQLASRLKVNQ